MSKKTYTVGNTDLDWQCFVEIDHAHENIDELIKGQVEFWTGWKETLDQFDGDYTRAYLSNLASEVWYLAANNKSLFGIKDAFSDKEGWAPIDGSHGVTLLRADSWEFPEWDNEVEEKQTP